MTILYLVPFTLLFLGDGVHSEDNGLITQGIGCDPSNDPCLECYACSEFGRCVQVLGCMPSEEPPTDSASDAVQDLPGVQEGADGVDDVESLPIDESSINGVDGKDEVDAIYESPVDESGDESESEYEFDRVADALDKSFGANGKGEGIAGSSNTMGDCKYDGSLGMSAESREYQAECMRLSMAECKVGGSQGVCVYVAAEGSAIGCIWDGTGCGMGCIPANMESRCAELSHDTEACDGDEGRELRCKWSKAGADTMGLGMADGASMGTSMGMNQDQPESGSMPYPQNPDTADTADSAQAVEEGVDTVDTADTAESEEVDTVSIPAESVDAVENEGEEESVSMGYPADGEYGQYYAGYPAEGDYGSIPDTADTMALPPQHRPKSPADKRRGERREESSLFDASTFFDMDADLSSRDIVIVVILAVATLTALYQLYRWCVNWKLHREYKLVNTSDRAARPSHCIIDGQAYF